MPWIAGADGCKRGWFRALRETETGVVRFDVVDDARGLLESQPQPVVLAIDIPIGLTETGPRECDRCARQRLGRPRQRSVFPAPIRAALSARTRDEASRITQLRDGRRVSAQAWGIYAKIRSVDELLRSHGDARGQIREIHPEVSFWAWNGFRPIIPGKKTREGKQIRLDLVEGWLGEGVLNAPRDTYLKREVADDDMLDAVAALWTACRIYRGTAQTLPGEPHQTAPGSAGSRPSRLA